MPRVSGKPTEKGWSGLPGGESRPGESPSARDGTCSLGGAGGRGYARAAGGRCTGRARPGERNCKVRVRYTEQAVLTGYGYKINIFLFPIDLKDTWIEIIDLDLKR